MANLPENILSLNASYNTDSNDTHHLPHINPSKPQLTIHPNHPTLLTLHKARYPAEGCYGINIIRCVIDVKRGEFSSGDTEVGK